MTLLLGAIAFGASAFIGISFGYFPARNAAYLDPVESYTCRGSR